MSEHIRPAHPGCTSCQSYVSVLRFNGHDLADARVKLVRAQGRAHIDGEDAAAMYADDIKSLQSTRAETVDRYHQHYAEAHPSFADSDAPFAKSPSHRLTADDIAEIKQLLREGVPRAEIAEAFNVTVSAIQYHSSRAGLDRPTTKADQATENATHGLTRDDQPWAVDALCAQTDPEAFFPDRGGSTREAKSICASCTVAAECLDYALANEERFGIWGGLSERERRRLTKAIKNAQEEPTPPTEGTAA